MSITTETVVVTPKIALEWLEGNTHNRKLREHRVKLYAKDMAEGRWMFSHQGIAFNEEGTMVDGQHRLWAILESNTAVTLMVSKGVPMSAQMIIDDHLGRSAVDALRLSTGASVTFATTALVGLLVHGFRHGKPSHMQIAEGLERFKDAVEFCDRVFRPRVRQLSQSAIQAAVARAYYSVDRDVLEKFVEAFITGLQPSGVTENQYKSVMLLRNHILFRVSSNRKRARRTDLYERTERALHAFVQNEKLGKLYPAKEELFPLSK
jgi:hypothetical protein